MAVYLITFKLSNPAANPVPLVEAIKRIANGWMFYIPTSIFINSSESANAIAAKITPFVGSQDYLIIVRITKEHQGWMPKAAWDWLNERTY